MTDLVPDPIPSAKEWKREIFLYVDAIINPSTSTAAAATAVRSQWAYIWSWRYGSWGLRNPDLAIYLDILVGLLLFIVAVELSSNTVYAVQFRHWVSRTIFRKPSLDLHSLEVEEHLYRLRAIQEASMQHRLTYRVDPFEGMQKWEVLYGKATVRLLMQLKEVVAALLLLYIVWFIIKYFAFVSSATWSLYRAGINYVIRCCFAIIVAIVPRFIRKMLKLDRLASWPSFTELISKWRTGSVDPWIRAKFMAYMTIFYLFKERTYGSWKRQLVEEPAHNLISWYQRFRKVHVDLSYQEFLRIVVHLYPLYAKSPETIAYEQANGAKAALQRFLSTVSKGLHWAHKRRVTRGSVATPEHPRSTRRVPTWILRLPVLGLYLLLALLLFLSGLLWYASYRGAPHWKDDFVETLFRPLSVLSLYRGFPRP